MAHSDYFRRSDRDEHRDRSETASGLRGGGCNSGGLLQKIPSNMVPSTVTAGLQDRLANLAQQIFSSTRLQALIEQDGVISRRA